MLLRISDYAYYFIAFLICFFTNTGQLHTVKAADLPFGKLRDKGVPVDNISNYDSARENIVYAASQTDLNLYRVIFATKLSMLKIVDGGEFDVSKRTVAATKLQEGDEVISVVTVFNFKLLAFPAITRICFLLLSRRTAWDSGIFTGIELSDAHLYALTVSVEQRRVSRIFCGK